MTTRTIEYLSGKDLSKLMRSIRSKSGPFKGYSVWLDVTELDIQSHPPKESKFYEMYSKWDRFEKYYCVTVNYEAKQVGKDVPKK